MKTVLVQCTPDHATVRFLADEQELMHACAWMRVELPSLALKDVRIADDLVREHERMLTDGFYAELTLSYDGIIAQQQNGRPFAIDSIRPIQMSKSDVLDVYEHGRRAFSER